MPSCETFENVYLCFPYSSLLMTLEIVSTTQLLSTRSSWWQKMVVLWRCVITKKILNENMQTIIKAPAQSCSVFHLNGVERKSQRRWLLALNLEFYLYLLKSVVSKNRMITVCFPHFVTNSIILHSSCCHFPIPANTFCGIHFCWWLSLHIGGLVWFYPKSSPVRFRTILETT